MRIIADTNVIVSAFINPAGQPAIVLKQILKGNLEICFNTAILAEYEEVLRRIKFAGKFDQMEIQRFFEIIHSIGHSIIETLSNIDFADESDRKFYDIARTASAYLITGNAKHYPHELWIYSPSAFIKRFNFEE